MYRPRYTGPVKEAIPAADVGVMLFGGAVAEFAGWVCQGRALLPAALCCGFRSAAYRTGRVRQSVSRVAYVQSGGRRALRVRGVCGFCGRPSSRTS